MKRSVLVALASIISCLFFSILGDLVLAGRGVELHNHMGYFYPNWQDDVGTYESAWIGAFVHYGSPVIGFLIPILLYRAMGFRKKKNQASPKDSQAGAPQKSSRILVVGGCTFLILCILAILLPSFWNAGPITNRNNCTANLLMIEAAKEQWAMKTVEGPSATPTDNDLFGPKAFIKEKPACPSNGVYRLNTVDKGATCSIEGHSLDY